MFPSHFASFCIINVANKAIIASELWMMLIVACAGRGELKIKMATTVGVGMMLAVVGMALLSGKSLTDRGVSVVNLSQDSFGEDASSLLLTASDEYGDTTASKFAYPFLGIRV
jgi:hypothetical protein